MAKPGRKLLPYQFTLGGLLAVITAFCLSLGLFRWAWIILTRENIVTCSVFLNVIGGASLMGAAIGAAIGQAFRDDRGGTAIMGAYVGAIVAPPLLLALLLLLAFAMWTAKG